MATPIPIRVRAHRPSLFRLLFHRISVPLALKQQPIFGSLSNTRVASSSFAVFRRLISFLPFFPFPFFSSFPVLSPVVRVCHPNFATRFCFWSSKSFSLCWNLSKENLHPFRSFLNTIPCSSSVVKTKNKRNTCPRTYIRSKFFFSRRLEKQTWLFRLLQLIRAIPLLLASSCVTIPR